MFHVKLREIWKGRAMERHLKSFSIEQFADEVAQSRLPKFRAMQVLDWTYGKAARSYDEMTNLPLNMRAQLSEAYPLHSPHVVMRLQSEDGSVKYLVEYHDGARVETVGLPSGDGRLTVCASSQSGCAMGCVFCATGRAGLTRSLLPGEIVDQIHVVQSDFGRRVTNVVVMGQGEPFSNYGNTLAALRILNHPKLLNIGARHITVSTCGVISGIKRLSQEREQFTLAVSLHSAIQGKRDTLMPSMASQKLGSLKKALESYAAQTGRRFSFEYALMDSVNDSEEDLHALISYCRGLLCHVNLIPLNAVPQSPIEPASPATVGLWQASLEKAGIAASIRKSRGSDIAAACGQLASQTM